MIICPMIDRNLCHTRATKSQLKNALSAGLYELFTKAFALYEYLCYPISNRINGV